ncbi:FtsK/SpoIIIE domain-containing protein [Nocardia paucivorans]|uniref:FtsK/SpoIIIE domain-containing protein n=1 Tax=Nocardia paucivorans TaxID=114259 RepID=UPI0002F135F7|nr:FtsK/SpoIIIE domain-containing protein [Nocardia paucivorans]
MLLGDLMTMGGIATTGWFMWQWRKAGAGPAVPTPEDHAAAAPVELRTAVSIVTDPAQLALMWPALGLGSPERGWPNITAAAYTEAGMAVEVQMLGGQSLRDWNTDATRDALAAYFGVPEVRVSSPYPGFVRLELRTFDTLHSAVSAPPPIEAASAEVIEPIPYQPIDLPTREWVDLEAVPVGITEDFDVWRLRVLYGHILLAGATGSGKGSVLWSLIAGLGPAIRAGIVDVWLADPKGGTEFGAGERLWVRFAWDAEEILAMLREAVQVMNERAARMRQAGIRKLIPSTDEPLILIIIDEAASLSAYATREQATEFQQLTGMLLSKGRSVGVSVVAALQDPSKETMPNRQLFPIRIGLRLDEPTQTTMVHGQGARDRGARCDEISELTPGVGYVGEDGTTAFVRVRAFWVSDDDIDRIVDAYAPAQPDLSPQGDYSGFDPDDLGDGEQQGRAA